MLKTTLRRVAAGALLSLTLCVALSGTPVRAQITVEPQSLSVSVPQHETAIRTVMLTNAGSKMLSFCVNFDRPLQRMEGKVRLVGDEKPCGAYGEVLCRLDDDDVSELGWSPSGLTMTPEGRLFTSSSTGLHRTFELTPDLTLLRWFEHPHVAELTPFSGTWGIGYDTEDGTLWWMNGEITSVGSELVTRRVLLLEGDLNGVETGRRIEIVPPETPLEEFGSGGLSYDPAADLFYFLGISDTSDSSTRKLWAVDRAGILAEGYPLRPEPYPPPALIGRPDVHGGAEDGPEGVRVEYGVFVPFGPGFDRIVVVDRWGNSEDKALETPVPAELFEAGGAGIRGNPLRSRIDPNGVMYMTFNNFEGRGIVGVRPHPLPPSWLVVDSEVRPEAAWDGTLAPGESRTIMLTFWAGARAVGDYTSSLQAFDAATGEAVVVPLTLTVTQGTDAEEVAEPESAALAVYPNPSSGNATVALTLAEAGGTRVSIYDVLGREVAVLADGWLAAGIHRLVLDEAGLPSGVYLVQVEGVSAHAVQMFTVAR